MKTTDKVVIEVAKDIDSRSVIGIEKYGTTLERKDLDLKDWLQHAYEETLDKALYLKRAIIEMSSNEVEAEQQKTSSVEQSETISSIIEELIPAYIKAKGEEPTLLIMNTELFNKLCKEYVSEELILHFRGVKIELNLEMEQGVIYLR